MSLRRHALLLAATMPAVACSGPPPAATDSNQVGSMGAPAADVATDQVMPADNTAAPVAAEAAYLGRWIGPEGLLLEVKPKPGGGVTVTNQWTLDDRGTFDGAVTAEGLRFMRGQEAVTAVAGNGDATAMKWLAGKRNCLIVKSGEGYCRD